MRKTIVVGLSVFIGAAVLFAQTRSNRKDFGPARLGNVLHCLQAKASSFGYAPPRFDAHSFRVRYVYGKFDPSDENDELHLVVYGPRQESATLFEIYLHGVDDNKPGIFIGEAATLKREHGRLVVDENPGGVGTYRRIEKLLRVISNRAMVAIPDEEVRQGPTACVYQP